MAAGDVNPGPPGFLLEWVVQNDGTTSWEGDYSLDVPSGWTYDCDSPGVLAGGTLDYLTCTVEMPLDVTPGSMPAIGAIVNAGDLSLLDIVSIQVSSAQSASISLSENSLTVLENGKGNNIEIEIRNTGNSPFEHRIEATSLDGWDVQLIDDPTISLNQQSLALIDISVSPNEPGFGVIRVQILGPDDVVIASEDLMFESRESAQESTDSGVEGIIFVFAGLLVLFGVAIILFVSKTSKGRSSSPNSFTAILPPPPTTPNLPMSNSKMETTEPLVLCWACSGKIESQKRRACPSCGARYHLVGDCLHSGLDNCRRCEALSSTFVEE